MSNMEMPTWGSEPTWSFHARSPYPKSEGGGLHTPTDLPPPRTCKNQPQRPGAQPWCVHRNVSIEFSRWFLNRASALSSASAAGGGAAGEGAARGVTAYEARFASTSIQRKWRELGEKVREREREREQRRICEEELPVKQGEGCWSGDARAATRPCLVVRARRDFLHIHIGNSTGLICFGSLFRSVLDFRLVGNRPATAKTHRNSRA